MNNKNGILMNLNLSALKNALNQLETSMGYYESDIPKKDPELRRSVLNFL